jgi:phi13 family phage major tail protein
MPGKVALRGFKQIKLFPIITDSTTDYETDTGFDLPEAQAMTQEVDQNQTPIYADDAIYLNLTSFNGINSNITLAELTLPLIAQLGFGTVDGDGVLSWNPQGSNKAYGMTFMALLADGNYRMYRFYNFMVTSVTEAGRTTKGADNNITPYTVNGMFTTRKLDGKFSEIKDSTSESDLTWVDSMSDPSIV